MRMPLTERERITLLMMRGYGDRVRSYSDVVQLFNSTFPDRASISKSTVQKIIVKFEQTGSVDDKHRSGRPRTATDNNVSLDVLQSYIEDPNASLTKFAEMHDISRSSVARILRRNKVQSSQIKTE